MEEAIEGGWEGGVSYMAGECVCRGRREGAWRGAREGTIGEESEGLSESESTMDGLLIYASCMCSYDLLWHNKYNPPHYAAWSKALFC